MTALISVDGAFAHIDPKASVQEAVAAVRDVWAVHATYHAPQVTPAHSDAPYVASTYSPEWLGRYLLRGYARIDPIVKHATDVVLPFDWSEVEPTPEAMDLMIDALDHGLGPVGYTVPMRDRALRTSLFSLNGDMGEEDWGKFVRANRAEIADIAQLLHNMAQREIHGDDARPNLSAREHEILLWTAKGKTAEEIALIVGVKPHTVRGYQKSTRLKLNCSSLAHAVSTAIHLGLIRDV